MSEHPSLGHGRCRCAVVAKEPETQDTERLKWLLKNGHVNRYAVGLIEYLMNNADNAVASHIVDFCINEGFAPAYWRQPVVSDDGKSVERTEHNGLVFVRKGDRQRIDEVMSK